MRRSHLLLATFVTLADASCGEGEPSRKPRRLAGEAASVTRRGRAVAAFELAATTRVAPGEIVARYRGELGLGPEDTLALAPAVPGVADLVHVRGEQLHRGVPVAGTSYSLAVRDGAVVSGIGWLVGGLELDPEPAVSEDDARARAFEALAPASGEPDRGRARATLLIAAPGATPAARDHRLVWRVEVVTRRPVGAWRVDIDARTGAVVEARSELRSVDVPAQGVTFDGQTVAFTADELAPGSYRLRQDGSRAVHARDRGELFWWDAPPANPEFLHGDLLFDDPAAQAGVSAYFAGEQFWDLLAALAVLHPPGLGAHGLDGAGAPIELWVDVAPTADLLPGHAFFSAYEGAAFLAAGDGASDPAVSPAIVGHELGHGVVQLALQTGVQAGEPEAWSEGFADVFGVSLAHYIDSAQWSNPGAPVSWTIGDGVFDPGDVRNLADPKSNGAPDTYLGEWWDLLGEDPHRNGAVIGHWFYLVSQGNAVPETNDKGHTYQITGIGPGDAAFVVLHAFRTGKIGAAMDFAFVRLATQQSAGEIFGTASPEYAAVRDAWDAVGVGQSGWHDPPDGSTGVDPWPVPLQWEIVADPGLYVDAGLCGGGRERASDPCDPAPGTEWEVKWDLQVSTSPTFDPAEDPALAYTTDLVTCAAYFDPISWDLEPGFFKSGTFCTGVLPYGLNLFPLTTYYWRVRPHTTDGVNPAVPDAWGATHYFTTGKKQTTNLSPATGVHHVFPWPADFDWTPVGGAVGYRLQVDRACLMAPDAAIVGPGATLTPTDIMQKDVPAPPAGMDLDILSEHCFTIIPIGPPIGPFENLGTRSYRAGNAFPGQYDDFKTSGAEPLIVFPEHEATGVPPWKNHFEWGAVKHAGYYEAQVTALDDAEFTGSWPCPWDPSQSVVCSSEPLHTLTTYLWRVRARGPLDPRTGAPRIGDYADLHDSPPLSPLSDDDGPWGPASSLSFTTSDAKVKLLDPPNGAGGVGIWPTVLVWEDNGALSYDLQVHTEPTFEDADGNVLPGVTFEAFEPCSDPAAGTCASEMSLAPETVYYWRVMGHGPNDDDGAWSEVWSFETMSDQVECVHPCDGETVYPWPVQLKFKRLKGATSYELEAKDVVKGGGAYWRTFTLDAGKGGGDSKVYVHPIHVQPAVSPTFDWRVRAIFPYGNGAWSDADGPQFYKIDQSTAPDLCPNPANGCPANGATGIPYDVVAPLDFTPIPGAQVHHVELCEIYDVDLADPAASCPHVGTGATPAAAVADLGYVLDPNVEYVWRAHGERSADPGDPHGPKIGHSSPWSSFITKNPPPPAAPCGSTFVAGGPEGANLWVDLGMTSGLFDMTADLFAIPDQVLVYDDLGLVADSGCGCGPIGGFGLPFQSATGAVNIIVIGNCGSVPGCNPPGATEWQLFVECAYPDRR